MNRLKKSRKNACQTFLGTQRIFKIVRKDKPGVRTIRASAGNRIRIIIAGGTMDKYYDELKGKLTFNDTHLPDMLAVGRCRLPVVLEISQLIDSLHMQAADRLKILESCRRAAEKHIIITHGTDTMVDTAAVLGRARMSKTVVLTGALIPYQVRRSDAVFNLGSSLIAVQILPPGVYVCMNGGVFAWDNVRKNRRRGAFEPITY